MNAHRIVATLAIAIGLLAIAIPDAQAAEKKRCKVVMVGGKAYTSCRPKSKPVDRPARNALEKKIDACFAICCPECRK